MVLWRPTRPSRTHTQKRCPFHHRRLECKSRKSRDTWSNRQIWPWSKNEAAQRLTEFCQENALVIANTLFQQHKRRLYTWTSPDGQYRNQIDYLLCSQRWKSSVQSAKIRPGADCGSDHELLIANSDWNWRKKGIPLVIRVWPKSNPIWLYSGSDKQIQGIRSDRQSAWRTMDRDLWHCRGGSDQDHTQEKEMQKAKIVVWGGLTNSWEKRSQRQRRKEKYTHLNTEF